MFSLVLLSIPFKYFLNVFHYSYYRKNVSVNRINTEMGLCFINKSQSWTPWYFSHKPLFNLPVIVELKCHRLTTFEFDFIVVCRAGFGAQCTLLCILFMYLHLDKPKFISTSNHYIKFIAFSYCKVSALHKLFSRFVRYVFLFYYPMPERQKLVYWTLSNNIGHLSNSPSLQWLHVSFQNFR